MFPDPNSRSAQLFGRAQDVLVGGNSRFAVYTSPYQIYAARGSGSRVIDIDGVERIDFQNNMTVLVHGHAHPAIVECVRGQLARGTCFGLSTEAEVSLAELLCSRVASFEKVRFVNSGTEAVMTAIKAARAYTGRSKIAKVEGAYHGSYDYAEVSLASTPGTWGAGDAPTSVPYAHGTPQAVLDDVVVVPFNNCEATLKILESHRDELAGVLIDPLPGRLGLVPASRKFLHSIQRLVRQIGALLIFDEVICFRLGYHGAQAEFGCEPDLTALGKVVGGGFPIGVVAGRDEVMAVFDLGVDRPLILQGGTFNGNPVTMVAGLTAMELLTPQAFERLNALGDLARSKIAGALRAAGFPGRVTGMGSLFRIHTTARPISDYRSFFQSPMETQAAEWLWRYLLNHGILLTKVGMGSISTVTSEADIESLADALSAGMKIMLREGMVAA